MEFYLIQELSPALIAGCSIRRLRPGGGYILIKSLVAALALPEGDLLAENWELCPRNKKELSILESVDLTKYQVKPNA